MKQLLARRLQVTKRAAGFNNRSPESKGDNRALRQQGFKKLPAPFGGKVLYQKEREADHEAKVRNWCSASWRSANVLS